MPTNVTGYNIPVPDATDPVNLAGTSGDLAAMATAVGTALDGRLPLNSTLYFPAMRSGRYYGASGNGFTSTNTQSQMRCYPVIIPNAVTIDRIGAEVTTGAAGSTVRLGIYENNPTTDEPGDLVIDAGTIDGNTTGFQEITISQALTPGIYWVAMVPQGGNPTTRNSTAIVGPFLTPGITTARTGTNNIASYPLRNSVTGALPDPAGTTGTTNNSMIVQFRVA